MYASEIIENRLLASGMDFIEVQLLLNQYLEEEAEAFLECTKKAEH